MLQTRALLILCFNFYITDDTLFEFGPLKLELLKDSNAIQIFTFKFPGTGVIVLFLLLLYYIL